MQGRARSVECRPSATYNVSIMVERNTVTAIDLSLLENILLNCLAGPTKNNVEPMLKILPKVYVTANFRGLKSSVGANSVKNAPKVRHKAAPTSR